jgi:hypothetical protein
MNDLIGVKTCEVLNVTRIPIYQLYFQKTRVDIGSVNFRKKPDWMDSLISIRSGNSLTYWVMGPNLYNALHLPSYKFRFLCWITVE